MADIDVTMCPLSSSALSVPQRPEQAPCPPQWCRPQQPGRRTHRHRRYYITSFFSRLPSHLSSTLTGYSVCLEIVDVLSPFLPPNPFPLSLLCPTDDVLHIRQLPTFDGRISARQCELLLQYLTVPYLRIPLVLQVCCLYYCIDENSI